MWIVATEPIERGAEIRIDYEGGEAREYWLDGAPKESAWRDVRAAPPAKDQQPLPDDAMPAVNVLDAIREAVERSRTQRKSLQLPAALVEALGHARRTQMKPLPRKLVEARIQLLAPRLARTDNRKTWGLLATHVPGWSGRECYQRWVAMGRQPPLQDQQEPPPPPQSESSGKRWPRSASVVSTILRTMQ